MVSRLGSRAVRRSGGQAVQLLPLPDHAVRARVVHFLSSGGFLEVFLSFGLGTIVVYVGVDGLLVLGKGTLSLPQNVVDLSCDTPCRPPPLRCLVPPAALVPPSRPLPSNRYGSRLPPSPACGLHSMHPESCWQQWINCPAAGRSPRSASVPSQRLLRG